jgi:RNA polymerase sigma factor (sigma-70 family)
MSEAVSNPILQAIRRMTDDGGLAALPDRELLRLFRDRGDADAFQALLRRHGPMVLDVCRAVSPTAADAEDAFQATFLALVRHPGAIRKAASVGSWLHGVAYRTAFKARVADARRRRHEALAPQHQPSAPDDLSWREVRCAVHEELGRLAERHRDPLVLCYLQGKSQDEAAAELGIPKGTLKGRLEAARALLRARLVRRGLGSAAVLLASAWPATAAPPAALVSATTGVALSATGGAAGAAVPAAVRTLAEGAIGPVILAKTRAAVLAVVVAAAAVGAHAAGVLTDGPSPPNPGAGPNARLPRGEDKPVPVDPKARVLLKGHTSPVYAAVFSADGNTLATASYDKTVRVWDVTSGKERAAVKLTAAAGALLSADGRTLATVEEAGERRVRIWDAATGRQVGEPVAGSGAALSPDGRTLVLSDGWKAVLWDVPGVRKRAALAAEMAEGKSFTTWTFSPYGKTVAVTTADRTVVVWDAATGQKLNTIAGHAFPWPTLPEKARPETRVPQELTAQELKDLAAANFRLAYSPDGRTLATARGGEVRFWDVRTGRAGGTFPARTDDLTHLAFSADGRTLIGASRRITPTGARPGAEGVDVLELGKEYEVTVTVRRWDVKTGRAAPEVTAVSLKYGRGEGLAAFSPGLTRMAVPAGDSVRVSDVPDRPVAP